MTDEGKRALARERFEKAATRQGKIAEMLVSASDDCIVYLWDPTNLGEKPLGRLLGHQKQVNSVSFSPDTTLVASTGWDNVTKVWDARDGKFLHSLRGHVGPCVPMCILGRLAPAGDMLKRLYSKGVGCEEW